MLLNKQLELKFKLDLMSKVNLLKELMFKDFISK